MAERIILHIGVHKTGTTAVQVWADTNRELLQSKFGLDVYRGRLGGGINHIEFPLLCMRSDRNLHARVMHPDSCLPSWQEKTRAHIAAQLATPFEAMFISAEGLSYLRRPDELRSLRELLGPRDIRIIVARRDPEAFLRSYRAQMRAMGYRPSVYPESFNYVESDTWVARFDELIEAYSEAFGDANICVLSYEDAVAQYGSSIPAVARAAGLPLEDLPPWDGVWLNSTKQPETATARARRALRHPWSTLARRAKRTPRSRARTPPT